MTIISKLISILDKRVAAEAKRVKVYEIAATANVELEYQWLVASLSTVNNSMAGLKTVADKAGAWKYRNNEWFADQLP